MTSQDTQDRVGEQMSRLLDFECDSLYLESVTVDQWWAIRLRCNHNFFDAESHGPLDLWRALTNALDAARDWHEEFYKSQGEGPEG